MHEYELYHYGVKGMKWGIRKESQLKDAIKNARMIKKKNKDFFRYVGSMSKIKNKDDILDWSENEDAKIRDDLFYGKITKKEAKQRSNFLASQTEYMLKSVNGRKFINNSIMNSRFMNSRFMNLSIQQANQFAMEQATRASINSSLQAASLSMSGGTTPFMFGMM